MELLFSCGAFAGGDIFASCTTREGSHGDFILSFSGFGNGFTGIEPATCGWVDKGKGDDLHAPKDENNDDKWECVDGIYSLEFDGIPKGAKSFGHGQLRRHSRTDDCGSIAGRTGGSRRTSQAPQFVVEIYKPVFARGREFCPVFLCGGR